MRQIIHAVSVHHGGGGVLLASLLENLPTTHEVLALLDQRMSLPQNIPGNVTIISISGSICKRFLMEWWLLKNVGSGDRVLCFGNLPPLFKLQGFVSVFVQNRYLVDASPLIDFALMTRFRLKMERIWFRHSIKNADKFIVQTLSMKVALLSSGVVDGQLICIRPFVDNAGVFLRREIDRRRVPANMQYDYLYPATGDPHKNHRRLVEAWCLLAEKKLYPTLCLTIDVNKFKQLSAWIEQKKTKFCLRIENVGFLPHGEAMKLYGLAGALIYPSWLESFGLPLIEARKAGLDVLAAELDYVRDVLDPEESFDPYSPISIARAVIRHLGSDEQNLPLLDAKEFLNRHVADYR